MAIIIPSKYIYKKQNEKVIDDTIDNAEIQAKEVVLKTNPSADIYGEELPLLGSKKQTESNFVDVQKFADITTLYRSIFSSACIIVDTYNIRNIKIPKDQKNFYVRNIADPTKQEIASLSKEYNVTQKQYTVPNSATVYEDDFAGGKLFLKILENEIKNYPTEELTPIKEMIGLKKLSSNYVSFTSYDNEEIGHIGVQDVKIEESSNNDNVASITMSAISNDGTLSWVAKSSNNFSLKETSLGEDLKIQEYETYYAIENFKYLTARKIYYCGTAINEIPTIITEEKYYPSTVVLIEQNVTKATLSVFGETLELDLEDTSVISKIENSVNYFSIDGNELTQTSNYYKEENSEEEKNLLELQADNLLLGYQNGKEIVTLSCAIADYYDESNAITPAISIDDPNKSMCFQLYDKVIPMEYTYNLIDIGKRKRSENILKFSENAYYFGFDGTSLNSAYVQGSVSSKGITVSTTQYKYGIGVPVKVEEFEKLTLDFAIENGTETSWNVWVHFYSKAQTKISEKQFVRGRNILVPQDCEWVVFVFCSTVGSSVTFTNIFSTSNKKHDTCISRYEDGTAKQFQVLSSRVYYDGRVLQDIECQEIPQTFAIGQKSFRVSFFANNARYATLQTENGKITNFPADPPTETGYYFDGWNTSIDGNGFEVNASTTFYHNTNVYAQIQENTELYEGIQITFWAPMSAQMQKNGEKKMVKVLETNGGGYLTSIPFWNIPYYNFVGWYTLKGEKITTSYKFLEDTNVYAMYVEKTAHTMDLPTNISDLNNDSGFLTSSGVVDIINETVIPSISANTQDINSLRSELNKNNETLSGSIANISERITNAEKDIISIKGEDYARYTITFMRNYNSSDNVVLFKLLTDNKQSLTSLPTATREGYDFDGWYTEVNGGYKITTNVQYNRDTTVYAQWKEKSTQQPTITLTIKNNVNTNTITKTYTAGSLYTFDTPPFSFTEKEFDKWTVGSAINEIRFNPNAPSVYAKGSIISLTENTTIYANYGTPKQYNVVFYIYHKNHTLSELSALPTTGNGVIIFPTQPDPTNYGYTENSSFAGWFTYTGTYQYKQGDKVFQDETYIYGSFEENPTNEPEEYEKYTDFISYSNIEDGYTSGWGANGLDITKLEEYLETTSPNDNNRYEIKIAPNYQTNIIQTIHSYSFVDYSDITKEKTLEYVIPPTVTSFGLRAFYIKNATIRFLGTQEQFEAILSNSPLEWATSDYEGKMFEVIVYFGYEDTVGTIYFVLRQE